MTKDEYLEQAFDQFFNQASFPRETTWKDYYFFIFEAGFNAACEYYRNNVLELQDNE